jgi:hypothetical protein
MLGWEWLECLIGWRNRYLLGSGTHAAVEATSRDTGAADVRLEAGWAPIGKSHGAPGLDTPDGDQGVVGHSVGIEDQAVRHELAIVWVGLDRVLLAGGLARGDNSGICVEREVKTREPGTILSGGLIDMVKIRTV